MKKSKGGADQDELDLFKSKYEKEKEMVSMIEKERQGEFQMYRREEKMM
jgi:hypothetical protein